MLTLCPRMPGQDPRRSTLSTCPATGPVFVEEQSRARWWPCRPGIDIGPGLVRGLPGRKAHNVPDTHEHIEDVSLGDVCDLQGATIASEFRMFSGSQMLQFDGSTSRTGAPGDQQMPSTRWPLMMPSHFSRAASSPRAPSMRQ